MNVPLATALRGCLREGYGRQAFQSDLMAGLVVGVVALPLSMALAIATGVAPQHGLYTAIVGGFLIALLGGSRVQVSGPTAAFVVILAPVVARFGLGGLLLAGGMAGLMLLAMGLSGLGRMIQFVPSPVITGFTAGIATVMATLQLKDLLGLSTAPLPDQYVAKLGALLAALPSWRTPELAVAALTLVLLVLLPRWVRRVPVALLAVGAGAGLAALLHFGLGFELATINSRFSYESAGVTLQGIPRELPSLRLPWHLPGAGGEPLVLSLQLVRDLLPSAFAIAMLGAIESLLSAVVADGMSGQRHDPDAELVALGIGNLVVPAFGGIAATGAIARTATNVRAGARSPVAAMAHALVVLVAMISVAPLLGHLPMASLAALLLLVAWKMSDAKHFLRLLRIAPRSDVVLLLTCFVLTVVFDMTVSITAGIVLAALLFMGRMAEVSGVTLIRAVHPDSPGEAVRGLVVYEIAGPLFFGVAQKALEVLQAVERRQVSIVVLDVQGVPALDATGLFALESLVADLNASEIKVVVAGIQPQPLRALARAGWRNRARRLRIFRSRERAMEWARRRLEPLAAAPALSPAVPPTVPPDPER